MNVWKEFDQNIISHSAAHHLMAVDELVQKTGYARVSDVARALNITRGSVSISLGPLKKAGLITQDENRHLRLSPAGQRLVDDVKAKRYLIQRLFSDVLGVDSGQAEIDACKIEHLLSSETARHIISMLRFMDANPRVSRQFLAELRTFDPNCRGEPSACPSCHETCLAESISESRT